MNLDWKYDEFKHRVVAIATENFSRHRKIAPLADPKLTILILFISNTSEGPLLLSLYRFAKQFVRETIKCEPGVASADAIAKNGYCL